MPVDQHDHRARVGQQSAQQGDQPPAGLLHPDLERLVQVEPGAERGAGMGEQHGPYCGILPGPGERRRQAVEHRAGERVPVGR